MINSENNNMNIPLIDQVNNGNFNSNNGVGVYDELLKMLSNQIPNNISNINNNYLNFNNFYQNNNNFNVINGLNNLSGMGNLINLLNLGQNDIYPNLNPKATNLMNDLNLLNSIIFENDINKNNYKNTAKFPNKEIEDPLQIKALNNIDSNNTNSVNNDNIHSLYAQNIIRGNDLTLTNMNESLLLNLLTGANNNNNNNQLFLNSNLNQFTVNPNSQNFLNNQLSNIQNNYIASTNNNINNNNNILNYINSNFDNNLNSKANENSTNTLNKNTGEEKTSEADPKNTNYATNNIAHEIQTLNNLNNLFTQPALNQQINSQLQNQTIDINQLLKIKAEEAQRSVDGLDSKVNNKSTRQFAFKNENDLMQNVNSIDNINFQMFLANQQNDYANLKQFSNLQDLQCVNKIFNMFNSEQKNNIKNKGNQEEIYSLNYMEDINKNGVLYELQNKNSGNEPNHSTNKNEENIINANSPNKIRYELSKENKIQELNPVLLLNILASQQISTSFEPVKIEDYESLNKNYVEKEAQINEAKQDRISSSKAVENLTNPIKLSQSEVLINPLLLKLSQNLTNQINNLPINSNQIEDLTLDSINQNKAFADLINLNQMVNMNARNANNNNNLLMSSHNNLMRFQNFLINNMQLNQFQGQLNINSNEINNLVNANDYNITNKDFNINRPNVDLDKVENFLQEYLKNCADPN